MRLAYDRQLKFGQVLISNINLNSNSRDDIPAILLGLQLVWKKRNVRDSILEILEKEIAPQISKNKGRQGLNLWQVFTLGTLRVVANIDYDRLHEYANSHIEIRQMLGLSEAMNKFTFSLSSIKKNVSLLSEEIINKINVVVVKAGHEMFTQGKTKKLSCKADSFVVETNVHYPTDISLLQDALEASITRIASLADKNGITEWRQYKYNLKDLNRLKWKAQNSKKTKVTRESDFKKYQEKIIKPHESYIAAAEIKAQKIEFTLCKIADKKWESEKDKIVYYLAHIKKQIQQIRSRIVLGEKIPHNEKVFSIFKSHTEWISKGKAGVPVELGVRVAVVEDHLGFILNHKVMEKQTDEKIGYSLIKDTRDIFPNLNSISFDKGFHSPANQESLGKVVENVFLPKKGNLSKARHAVEHSESFKKARKQHSAIESAINALEVHGLDFCPDYGIDKFKAYTALAIVGRNILQIGFIRRASQRKRILRQRNDDPPAKLAA